MEISTTLQLRLISCHHAGQRCHRCPHAALHDPGKSHRCFSHPM